MHLWGFGAATLALYDVLKPTTSALHKHPVAISIVLVMAGLGVGALNEIVEFMGTLLLPGAGVGGYINTSLDLCADLLGSLLALLYILCSEPWNTAHKPLQK